MVRFPQLSVAISLLASSDAFSGFTHTFKTSKCVESSTFILPQTSCANRVSSTHLYLSSAAESAPKSTLVKKADSSVEVSILASGSATKAAYDKVAYELSKTISVPGFRKGAKIPAAVLESAMSAKGGRNALRVQAIQTLLTQLLEPAIKEEHNLEPIGQPTLVVPAEKLAENFTPGEPIELTVRCDVWPDIKWTKEEGKADNKPYMNLEYSYKRKPFNQNKLDAAIRDLKERYAELTLAPLEKALEMGDACVVNMVGYMAAEDGVSKGEPLPNAASGDNVDIILGKGRYMDGLVEGLVGAKVGDTRTVSVRFPEKLRDKTLAGKNAVFDVSILEISTRKVPEIDDELAAKIRPGLTAESVMAELRKAVDEQESDSWVDARNKGIAAALSGFVDVEVPDTLITNQAKEKYAVMMTDFRDQGMADDEIKKLISPENFLKYKDIEKADIINDFKVSMAIDEIARLEGIEVPSYQVDEQLEVIKKDTPSDEKIDESMLRSKVETTLQRRLVYDFLAEHGEAAVSYDDEAVFDEKLMENLAAESLKREQELAKAAASVARIENAPLVEQGKDNALVTSIAETVAVTDGRVKAIEKTQRSLLQARIQNDTSAKKAALVKENNRLKYEAESKAKEQEKARVHAEAEAATKATLAEASRMKAIASEKVQRSLLQSRIQSDMSAKAATLARAIKAEIEMKEAEEARVQAESQVAAELALAKAATSEKVQRSLLQARIQSDMSAKAAALMQENDRLKYEAEIKAKEQEKARVHAEAEAATKTALAEASRMKAIASEKVQRSLLQSRIQSDMSAKAATLTREAKENTRKASIASARSQPKPADVEKYLAERYAKMDLSERAYNILKDLGMIDLTPDVDSPDYDPSADHDFVSS